RWRGRKVRKKVFRRSIPLSCTSPSRLRRQKAESSRSLPGSNTGGGFSPPLRHVRLKRTKGVRLPESSRRCSLTDGSAPLRPCVAIQEQPVRINVFERLGPLLQIGERIQVGG